MNILYLLIKNYGSCCHLHDEFVAHKTNDMNKILNYNGRDFNNLEKRSINEIIDSIWFKDLLEKSWNKNHPLHLVSVFSCLW